MATNKSTKAPTKTQANEAAKTENPELEKQNQSATDRETAESKTLETTTEPPVQEENAPQTPVASKSPAKIDVDLHKTVVVRNGFQGSLVYQSARTGEVFTWSEFGDEQDMEIGELRNARNSHKSFFINNWFMFDEPWIIDYLGVAQYYKLAVSVDDFDSIFSLPPEDLKAKIAALSDGQKSSIAYRASGLIAEGTIDSNKTITALEEALGVSLVERG